MVEPARQEKHPDEQQWTGDQEHPVDPPARHGCGIDDGQADERERPDPLTPPGRGDDGQEQQRGSR